MQIPLSRPDITEKEIEAVVEVLRSPDLSLGPRLAEFEAAFAGYIGRSRAVAVNSGTSGLFLCMLALGIGPGDEVITTPFTFIASANSVIMAGAKPVFVDIDPVSLNIDPSKIEAKITDRTKAILPVEVFGSPAGFDQVCAIAERHNLILIEDSCEALWLLDSPVSNSGRLKTLIGQLAEENGWNWQIKLLQSPDAELKKTDLVATTSDSVILDYCKKWVNLARAIIEQKVPQAKVIDLG